MSDKLITKINNIDISGFVLKAKYDTDKSESEKKIPAISRLVPKLDYNAKITEIDYKIANNSGLAKIAALTAVEKKYLILVVY